jgi:hypothetical protein
MVLCSSDFRFFFERNWPILLDLGSNYFRNNSLISDHDKHHYHNYYSSDDNNTQHYLNRIYKPSSYNSYDRNKPSHSTYPINNLKPSQHLQQTLSKNYNDNTRNDKFQQE